MACSAYRIKLAETEAEFEQIFELNQRTFAAELRQYPLEGDRLVDKFHTKNRYWIALVEDTVVGMIALHDQPPFSVAAKLADPRILDTLGRLAEVRLLAIHPDHRNRLLLAELLFAVYEQAKEYDSVAISGHADELAMYRRLGFREIGPPVRSGEAEYVPMVLRMADVGPQADRWVKRLERKV
jgi:N-acetylglutamate synthase-like GNAT family acetyltransferase